MRKHKLRINGKEVTAEEFHRNGPVGGPGVPMVSNTFTEARPWVGDIGSGVLPNQVEETRQLVKERGLTAVHIRDNGEVECTSGGDTGRMGWYKLRGGVDLDGGYRETYNSNR